MLSSTLFSQTDCKRSSSNGSIFTVAPQCPETSRPARARNVSELPPNSHTIAHGHGRVRAFYLRCRGPAPGVRLALMDTQFTPYDDEPRTGSSSRRSGGPPRKIIGGGGLDSPGHGDDFPRFTRKGAAFTAFVIIAVLAIMLAVALFLTR